MSPPRNVLAIDVGTQSARALAFAPDGRLLDGAKVAYPQAYVAPQPGWAEQDVAVYWDAVGAACRQLFAQGVVAPADLAGLAMTFQRSTLVNLDADGRPLRPAIVWLDQRRAHALPTVPPLWRVLTWAAGVGDTLRRLMSEAEVNWLREHQRDVWDRTAHFLMLSGWLTLKMTGRVRDSVACQVGYLPFDYKAKRWFPEASWRWGLTPVEHARLPELVPPGAPLGEVTAEAAAHTGLPEGLPVIAGGSDKACEVLGSGCVAPHQACIGYGTTATLNVDSPRYVEPVRFLPPYPSAQAGAWNLEFQIYRGFWMVTWFKEQFAQLEALQARERGVAPEALLEELAAAVPPGSLGLTLQPFWTPGVRYPGREAKGAMVGFGAAHHKPHMYRALLEGLAYAMREGRERTERRTRVPVRELYVCGGGSRSDLVMQITADVFGLPARRPATFEASGLGAAVLAAAGLGVHPDLTSAVGAMTRDGAVFEPRAEAAAVYDRLYREVYLPLYRRLSPLYRKIMDITGYPEA